MKQGRVSITYEVQRHVLSGEVGISTSFEKHEKRKVWFHSVSKAVLSQHFCLCPAFESYFFFFFLTSDICAGETSSKPCDIVPCEVAWAMAFKMHCKRRQIEGRKSLITA